MRFPSLRVAACACLGLAVLAGCTSVRRDDAAGQRQRGVVVPPLWWSSESPDGSSALWWTLFGLVGGDREDQRGTTRALPLWWHAWDGDEAESTLVFPLWFSREAPGESTRWYGPLYRRTVTPEWTSRHVLIDLFDSASSADGERGRSGLFLVYDHTDRGAGRHDLALVPALGLAHLATLQWGYPPRGVTVGAEGREAARRVTLLNLLGIVELFGYDDVGDTREWRLLTLFSNEPWSPIRSWRARGDGAFTREWFFPLWFDVADDDYRWRALGPLWGAIEDHTAGSVTDWWLLGLVSRQRAEAGTTWRLLGLPVGGP